MRIPSHRLKMVDFFIELILEHHGEFNSLLDLGCGLLHSVWKQRWGEKYEGLDIRESVKADYCMDACDLSSFKSDSRDVVTCWSTIEHVTHPYTLLEEMHRVSNGTCILTTDYTHKDKNSDPTHLYCWTGKVFKQLLNRIHGDNKVYVEKDVIVGVLYNCITKET